MFKKIRKVKMTILLLILLSTVVTFLLVRFYPVLRHSLFGGEILVSPDEIQFWVKKMPNRNYYRVYAKYLKNLETVMWWGHSLFFADSRGTLGFNDIFFNPEDNKIYGGGSEKERGWEWAFFCLGEGKNEEERFTPFFPRDTRFNFIQGGSLEITSAPRNYIKIYFPNTLKKLEKEELKKGTLAEIVEDTTKRK